MMPTSTESGFFGDMKTELFSKQTRQLAREMVIASFNASMYEMQNLMEIMAMCKGRDKVFGMIQYIFDFYVQCMKHSNESSEFQGVFLDRTMQQLIAQSGRLPAMNNNQIRHRYEQRMLAHEDLLNFYYQSKVYRQTVK